MTIRMSGSHQNQPQLSSSGQHQQQQNPHHQHHQQATITIVLDPNANMDSDQLISVTSAGDTYHMPTAAIPNNFEPSQTNQHYQHQQHAQHHQQHLHTDHPPMDHVEAQQPKTDNSRSQNDEEENNNQHQQNEEQQNQSSTATRFKWTKEKSQVAMNLVKYGCKPKLISVAVGCSLRTAQKFVETVSPKMEGEAYRNYVIRRRGRKSKDVNQRLDAIREVLSKDCTKTQVEIAADLKVSNTTVCRDLKRIGASWRDKQKTGSHDANNGNYSDSSRKDGQSNSSTKGNDESGTNTTTTTTNQTETRPRRKRRGRQTEQAVLAITPLDVKINSDEPNASVIIPTSEET